MACRARVGTYSSLAHKEEEGTNEYKKYKKYTLLKNNVETKPYVSPWETWENSLGLPHCSITGGTSVYLQW